MSSSIRMNSAIYQDTRQNHSKNRFKGPKYSIGTRVAERPKQRFDACGSPEGYKRAQAASSQRFGTVVENRIKEVKRKNGVIHRRVYVSVQWDHLKSPIEHDQQRICAIEDFKQITEVTRLMIGG